MIRLPLAARELTRISRGSRMHVIRTAVIALAFIIVFLYWFVERTSGRTTIVSAEEIGSLLIAIGTSFQVAIVFLVVPAIAGPLIADERRNNTLGLLMIADFSGVDIFVAKFIIAFAEAEFLLLTTMPLLGFGAMFGGTTVTLMVKQWFVLSLCALTMCSIGLFCSSLARHPITGIVANVLTAFAVFSVNILLMVWAQGSGLLWPARYERYNMVLAVAGVLRNDPLSAWWPGLALIPAVGAIAFILTLLWLPSAALMGPRQRWFGPTKAYGTTHRRLLRESPVAPFVSAHSAGLVSVLRPDSSRILVALGLAAVAMIPGVGGLMVLLLFCYDITLSLGWMRRSGALDDLSVTPLGGGRIARDIFRFHLKRAALYYPALVVIAVQIAAVHMQILYEPAFRGQHTYAALLAELPQWGFWIRFTAMLGMFFLFTLVQAPCAAAVACVVGISPARAKRQGVRAVIIMAVLYGLCLAAGTSGQLLLLRLEFIQRHSWLPGILFGAMSVLSFAAVGWYAYRKFVNSFSTPRAAPAAGL